MKRIKRRAAAALVLAILVVVWLGAFTVRLARDGGEWAAYSANRHIYQNGILSGGTITDRNGVVLAKSENGSFSYAEDAALRTAVLHAVGDVRGYTGTSALTLFAPALSGYDFVRGTPGGGADLALSLDSEVQRTAYESLAGRAGAVFVYNYENGEILCMASSPSYDPTETPDGSIDGLFLNRCIGAAYTPGSVFKLVTLLAAYENIPDLGERRFWCEQEIEIGGDIVHCTGWHGEQTVEQALANSCNCAFAAIARELGGETIAKYAEKLGLSGSLTLDGAETASGHFAQAAAGSSLEAWSGIGQHEDLVTPYAMARYCGAIAAGGIAHEPTLLLGGKNGSTRLLTAEAAEYLGGCMNYNVIYGYGSERFPGLDLCAKSGTAELGDGTTNAWFTGYLKSGAPLAFAVVIENGGGGLTNAGALANTVLQKAAEKYAP